MHMQILQPVVALMVWTMVMWVWMYARRIPVITKVDPALVEDVTYGRRTLDQILPARVQWVAHNYNHLHEAPTLFYAVAIVLGICGAGNGTNVWIAWAYVALRVAHSLVQATINKVMLRFQIFALSSLALAALIVQAVRIVLATS